MKAKYAARQMIEGMIELADALDAGGLDAFRVNNFVSVRLYVGEHAAYAVKLTPVAHTVDDIGSFEFTRDQVVVVREPRAGKAGLGWLTVQVQPLLPGYPSCYQVRVRTYDGGLRDVLIHHTRLGRRRR